MPSTKDADRDLVAAIDAESLDDMQLAIARGADPNAVVDHRPILSRAVRTGNVALVSYLLDNGGDIHWSDAREVSLMHVAAEAGSIAMVQLLLERGLALQSEGQRMSPLHRACGSETSDTRMVQYLLDSGLNVNAQTPDGVTPLHAAAARWNIDVMLLLLSHGADINAKDRAGRTPLDDATEMNIMNRGGISPNRQTHLQNIFWDAFARRDMAAIEFYLKIGANPNSRDGRHDRPDVLHDAVLEENVPLTAMLLQYGARVTDSACISACRRGCVRIVELLHAAGASVHPRTGFGNVGLTRAAESGVVDLARYLINHGADVHSRDQRGHSPVETAVRCGRFEMVEFLISQGVDVHVTAAEDHNTLLHVSTDVAITELLLNKGLDVDMVNIRGETPLHHANAATASVLIAHGADINARCNAGNSAIDSNRMQLQTMQMLLSAGAEVTPIHRLIRGWSGIYTSYPHEFEWALVNGADVNAIDEWGRTALYQAVQNSDTISTVLLYDHYADMSVRDHNGDILLHGLVKEHVLRSDRIKWLLKHHADPQELDDDGHTVLYRLITQPGRSPNKKAPIAHLLCRFGARLAPTEVITDEDRHKPGSWTRELEICVRLWTSQYDNGQQLTPIRGKAIRGGCAALEELVATVTGQTTL